MRLSRGKICGRCGADDWYVYTHSTRCAPCDCRSKWVGDKPIPALGRESPATPKATVQPTIRDIAWAAGLFEGEGCALYGTQTTRVSVSQNGRWVLDKLSTLFGGAVRMGGTNNRLSKNPQWVWIVSGARARGFGLTIYSFLSPRRKEQMLRALHVTKQEK